MAINHAIGTQSGAFYFFEGSGFMARKTNRVLKSDAEIMTKINVENLNLKDDFLNFLISADRTKETLKVYTSNLNIIFCWLYERARNKPFYELTKRDVMNFQNYMVRNELSSARIKNIRSTMSSLSDYIERMMDDEYPDFRNIISKVPCPPSSAVREKTVLKEDDVQELLDVLIDTKRYQVACFVAMAVFGGSRKSELVQYQENWFNDEATMNGLYVTPFIRTKGRGRQGKKLKKYILKNKVDYYLNLWREERKELGVDINDLFVVRDGDKWIPAKHSTANSFMTTCSNIMNQDIYSHALRHCYCTYLVRAGIPLEVVKDLVGHESVDTTSIYVDIDKEENFSKYFSDEGIVEVKATSLTDL